MKPEVQTADAGPAEAAIAPPGDGAAEPVARSDEELVEADLLVEDVSIDGMCGVY